MDTVQRQNRHDAIRRMWRIERTTCYDTGGSLDGARDWLIETLHDLGIHDGIEDAIADEDAAW